METALEEGVEDLLCPEGATRGGSRKKKSSKGFAKSAFHYDEQSDCYECPAGEKLVPVGQSHDDGKRFTRYGGAPCQHCELTSARATPEAEPSNATRMMRSRMRFGE